METKPIIYQLVVRYFGNTNPTNRPNGTLATHGSGKFADVTPAALRQLRDLGVTHVWLTGCLRQATLTDHSALGLPADDPDVVKGIAGSFYAIRDYFDVSPDYAVEPANRLAEFDALVRRVHEAGMKAMIDFVPNHVARGYGSVVRPDLNFGVGDDTSVFFSPANHFYYLVDRPGRPLRLSRPAHWNPPGVTFDGLYPPEDGTAKRPVKVTGNNCAETDPGPDPWYETVKLNFGYDFVNHTGHYDPRPRLWNLMDEILAYWQGRGVDGFRCDFAHYVPPEAWRFLLERAKGRDAQAYFIAEAYPWEGSGDPITQRQQLIDSGFQAVYNDASYDALKRIYLDRPNGQDDYHAALVSVSPAERRRMVQYMENHDERRIASPVNPDAGWTGNSGFGSADAGYLLAPLQYLCGPGPVLMLNGQEVGEPGADAEGYSGRDGRTTVFDYWTMPEMAKWVNGHAYDGGRLSSWQVRLRSFYADLLALCQDPCVRGDGYWGLKYFNRPERFADCPAAFYTFARYDEAAGRLLLVVANFDRGQETGGRVRVPAELLSLCGLNGRIEVRLRLNRDGATDEAVATLDADALASDGVDVRLPAESTNVYVVRALA
ncbi:MAG TPA: alpha-amylase family glycosyl hydrolase [Tepidisphaeraceae bacterium]|jgi:glycosidase